MGILQRNNILLKVLAIRYTSVLDDGQTSVLDDGTDNSISYNEPLRFERRPLLAAYCRLNRLYLFVLY